MPADPISSRQISFSIVIPAYNKSGFIRQALGSVMAQKFRNWECIVIDDCSTDDTRLVVEQMSQEDKRIRLHKMDENKGANYCRNLGVSMASGKYIIFFDADDILEPFCLWQRADFLRGQPGLDAAVFPMKVFVADPAVIKRIWMPVKENALQRFLAHDLPWHTMQPAWGKDFLLKIGGYNPAYLRLQDVEFHTRALLQPFFRFEVASSLPPDCLFRTGEERKVFGAYSFLEKWVYSARMYFTDFWEEASKRNINGFLAGTIYRTYYQLLLQRKAGQISKEAFRSLEQSLLDKEIQARLKCLQKLVLWVEKRYLLLPVSIPGINKLLNKLVIN